MAETATARERELVRGAVDLHVHTAPDVMPRHLDDITLARRCLEVGQAGFVIKSHYTPTAERAALVRAAVAGVEVLGAVTLNASLGGMNPVAVEIAAREGARVVWLPTVDAVNEAGRTPAIPPAWARIQNELREQGVAVRPVEVVDGAGRLLPETRAVLERVAQHGLVLATGHLGRDEIFAVVDAAFAAGVEQVIVTHPEFPAQDLSQEDQLALARKGAYLERCFTTPHSGKCSWETWLGRARAVGAERNVVSTDLGQPENPSPEDGLALCAGRLLQGGFSEDEVRTMIVANSRLLAGLAEIPLEARR